MDATEYQRLAARTLVDGPGFGLSDEEIMLIWNALGLAGEAGEVAELIKKGVLHRHGLDIEKLYKELGDTVWYIAAICSKMGFDLSEIMEANLAKLKLRYPNGYSSEDSIQRVDILQPRQ